uniref:Uncharacterized protein n=1 Tax=Guillardia theta TaxID=55529 RepID=A0A7S4P5V2_GUITH|mmetsp:Transcript_43891/g.138558  ORF Transcript_43891/g.138558 Transcript_43891/m.138558 type:complete len:301 (+) Transcript_43891:270-1172(+)
MVLVPDDDVKVESELYQQLRRDLGKNFELFASTVGLKEWKKKGEFVQPEQQLGSKRNALAFPPLLTRWSLRQTKEVVKDTGKPIRLSEQTKGLLDKVLGPKRVDTLMTNIGFDQRPARDVDVQEKEVKVFAAAWGADATMPNYDLNGTWKARRRHPVYSNTVDITDLASLQLGKLDDDRRNLVGVGSRVPDVVKFRPKEGPQAPHHTKVNGKFYWPHMTNPVAKIPVRVEPQRKVKKVSDWLGFYGEPKPDKIPTGTMTTFEPIAKIVAGGKSLAKNASCKVDGRTWKREFDQMRGMTTK